MGDLTKNLSRSEFACECGCGFNTIDFTTVTLIQDSVNYFEKKYNTKIRVSITGPNRCEKHNEEVQKKYNKKYIPFSSESTHMDAGAADHKHYYLKHGEWAQIPPKEVYDYYDNKYPNSIGLGLYKNRVHTDRRTKKARWSKV